MSKRILEYTFESSSSKRIKLSKKLDSQLKNLDEKVIEFLKSSNEHHTNSIKLKLTKNYLKTQLKFFYTNFRDNNKKLLELNKNIILLQKEKNLLQDYLNKDINKIQDESLKLLNLYEFNDNTDSNKIVKIKNKHFEIDYEILLLLENIQEKTSKIKELDNNLTLNLNNLNNYLLNNNNIKNKLYLILNNLNSYEDKLKVATDSFIEKEKRNNDMVLSNNNISKIIENEISDINIKIELKTIIDDLYTELAYFNHIQKDNGCNGCADEKCKITFEKMNHFKNCNNNYCIDCTKIQEYDNIYKNYIEKK